MIQRTRNSDPVALGMALRQERAVGDRKAFVAEAARITLASLGGTVTTPQLQALGGWTRVILAARGPEPKAEANGIGMATSTEWWRWVAWQSLLQDIRLETMRLAGFGYRPEVSK